MVQTAFVPTETFEQRSEFRRKELPSTNVDPTDLDSVYRIHAVAVREGRTLFILENRPSFDTKTLNSPH